MNMKHLLIAAAALSLLALTGTAAFAETKAADAAPAATADKGAYTECTVADVFAKKDTLVGKNIAVKGKVVKFSSGIMGTNWFHIQDGTGSAGTNDFVVTSHDVAKTGDQVVARGVLQKDVDFGAGYKYAVIIKDAKVSAK